MQITYVLNIVANADFAVGAPYQEVNVNSGNTGKIFIYYGSSIFTDDVADQVSKVVYSMS